MNDTTNAARLRCGEHGLPLFYAASTVMCDHTEAPCDLSWSDLRPEVGERIVTREGDEIFAAEVWVETVAPTTCPLHGEALHVQSDGWSCIESGFEPCVKG